MPAGLDASIPTAIRRRATGRSPAPLVLRATRHDTLSPAPAMPPGMSALSRVVAIATLCARAASRDPLRRRGP
jgi:hypothetical protein